MTGEGTRFTAAWHIVLVALAPLLAPGVARAEIAAVWALNDSTKVKRDELRHRLKAGNGVFSPSPPRVKLFGMRNETVAFQLILEGGQAPTSRVGVRLDAVGAISNQGAVDDPDRYFAGRSIELFAEHYLEVRERSRSIPWEPGTAAEPKGMTGPIPDPLVPLVGGRTVEVAARANQGVWVDIYIPKNTPAQPQTGRLVVEVDGQPCDLPACQLPVEIEVLDRTMPDQATARSMLFFSGGDDDRDTVAARYFDKPWETPDAPVEALRARHFKLLRRHRVTGFIGHDRKPTAPLRRRLSGAAFSRAAGYGGPGENIAQDLYSILTYGKAELSPQQAREWDGWLKKHAAAGTQYFYYVIDEPGDDDLPRVNARARRARPLRSFVTTHYRPKLEIDIFCALPEHFSVKAADRARAAGKQVWVYNGRRPYAGSFMVDDVAVAMRVNPWIQYRYGIPRWFYWEATYYRDFQGGRQQIDVWTEANNFRNADGDRLNGDGLLLYPGRDLLFPQQDRGLDMPLPSIRLKNWRRGIEDVEYLVAARQAGHGAFVDQLLSVMVPRALADELEDTEPVTWPEDGEKWLEARRKLFQLLSSGEAPALDAAQLAAPAEPASRRLKRQARAVARSIGKPLLLAIGGFVGVAVVALLAWVLHRRRTRDREDDFR